MGLVYSTEFGRMCPQCDKPASECACKKEKVRAGDGILRVRRESKGRGGKTVTVVAGCLLEEDGLKELLSDLKRRVGSGGTIKEGNIEIQGDFAEAVLKELEKKGFKVKRSGG